MQTNNRTNRRGFGWLIAILVLVLALLGGIWTLANRSDKAAGLVGDGNTAQLQEGLVVPGKEIVDCKAMVVKVFGPDAVVKLNDGRTAIVFEAPENGIRAASPPKASAQSVDVPVADPSVDTVLAERCRRPWLAAMDSNAFGQQQILGKTIAQLNAEANPSWVMPAQGDPAEISKWAASCFPKDANAATKEEVERHLSCEQDMENVVTLWALMHQDGVQTADSIVHYRLAGLVAKGFPPFQRVTDPKIQEQDGTFVSFTYGDNKTNACLFRFGINVGTAKDGADGGDQRFAQLSCEKKVKPTVAPTHPRPTPTPTRTTVTHVCVDGPNKGKPVSGGCPTWTGKQESQRPDRDKVTVVTCPSGSYLPRGAITAAQCVPYGSSSGGSGSGGSTTETGKGGSGAGATNTTQAPPTSSPAATIPVTSAPSATVAKP